MDIQKREYTPEYRQALEAEEWTRRHLDTCQRPALQCSTCFQQAVTEMLLIQEGKGQRAGDSQKEEGQTNG